MCTWVAWGRSMMFGVDAAIRRSSVQFARRSDCVNGVNLQDLRFANLIPKKTVLQFYRHALHCCCLQCHSTCCFTWAA
ncbi:hypothetical protein Poly24_43120 [Rosistilla carotiformis]|uniref:Uncharacterized protein n=1 Tax=Rosistilla carotiformis TaxID=2528017 RepID=A0A518JYG7_9BACT|nr:hypothetical protein Poly24_43120 [Rosistilla carotiformis]